MAYLSIARLKKLVHTNRSLYLCTCPGDGLASLPPKFSAFLLPPTGGPDSPPFEGQSNEMPGEAIPVNAVREGAVSNGKSKLQILTDSAAPSEQEGFRGFWLFVEDKELIQGSGNDLFAFELLSYACEDLATGSRSARIVGYQETGAHGILEVETLEGSRILVPLVAPHAVLNTLDRTVQVTDLAALNPEEKSEDPVTESSAE
ncbi:MAG: hypothetical protein RH862_18180 [Leptospiraceae bacterium]